MTDRSAEESVSEQTARLKEEMQKLLGRRDECRSQVRQLMAAEDPSRGIYHHEEIFSLKQESLRLEVEAEFCRKKINRLQLGYD
ncbi:MAG: hypothetical protein ACOCV7_01590 [Desulfonatronovibrionaceae bacterium]